VIPFSIRALACRLSFAMATTAGAASKIARRAIAKSTRNICGHRWRKAAARSAAVSSLDQAAFEHAATGFGYRVVDNRGSYSVELMKRDGTLLGIRQLPYFVGSGATARSYPIADDGYLGRGQSILRTQLNTDEH